MIQIVKMCGGNDYIVKMCGDNDLDKENARW